MDKTRIPTNSKIWPDSTCAISVRRKGQILLVVGILVFSTTCLLELDFLGFAIYFGYGIWSSAQAPSSDKQKGGELLNKLSAGPQSGPGGASSGYDALQSMENNQPVNQGGGTDYSMGNVDFLKLVN